LTHPSSAFPHVEDNTALILGNLLESSGHTGLQISVALQYKPEDEFPIHLMVTTELGFFSFPISAADSIRIGDQLRSAGARAQSQERKAAS